MCVMVMGDNALCTVYQSDTIACDNPRMVLITIAQETRIPGLGALTLQEMRGEATPQSSA